MLKTALTVLATAAACFAVAAATGLASGSGRVLDLKVGDTVIQSSNNFHCQVLSKTQIACGGKTLKGAVSVYYGPHQVNVVRFDKAGTKATVLFQIRR
jgi:hypothetical protein